MAPTEPVIVGIGASAGGLEALFALLDRLAVSDQVALVILHHHRAEHGRERLGDLLQRRTAAPVSGIREGERPEGGRIYVAPPDRDVCLGERGFTLLSPPPEHKTHMPVDAFLRSLADHQGGRAVGVVLSGTCSDGTLGLQALRTEGGITIAQDPASAGYAGMPESAIHAGAVDFILPPAEIADKIREVVSQSYLARPAPSVPEGDDLSRILQLLRQHSGTDFTYYKPATIRRRVGRRMAVHQLEEVADYLRLLERDQEELDTLYREVLVRVTDFFRDPEAFEALKTGILPQILAGKEAGDSVRVWVPGCATGEEAYSLALLIKEVLAERAGRP